MLCFVSQIRTLETQLKKTEEDHRHCIEKSERQEDTIAQQSNQVCSHYIRGRLLRNGFGVDSKCGTLEIPVLDIQYADTYTIQALVVSVSRNGRLYSSQADSVMVVTVI